MIMKNVFAWTCLRNKKNAQWRKKEEEEEVRTRRLPTPIWLSWQITLSREGGEFS